MRPCRIHVTGGSGSGTTTVGRALASRWSVPHADSDDYYWLPTLRPYSQARPVEERALLMETMFVARPAWVLSGSMIGWGDAVARQCDAIVQLVLEPEVRMARLRARERERYGDAIAAGGEREADHTAFMAWAEGYDRPDFESRSLRRQREWAAAIGLPTLELDGSEPVEQVVDAICAWKPLPL